MKSIFIVFIVLMLTACTGQLNQPDAEGSGAAKPPSNESGSVNDRNTGQSELIFPQGNTVKDRIMVPEGFERVDADADTFADYLRNLPLKPHGSKVLYYNGREKARDVYQAVVDMEIGDRDLQQCADAVMRLRAEFLYKQQQYEKINFNFTNGFNAQYVKWMQGNRIAVEGNNVNWVSSTGYSNEYSSFRKYLDMVFAYAGTLSLSKELEKVDISDMEIGHVFIQGGSPGHCVIVIDMAVHSQTGQKLFLLAQSYMPAQDIHILKNNQDQSMSPWYKVDFGDTLATPEWTFNRDHLMRFGE